MTQYFIFLPNMKAADALYIKELFKGEYFKLISTDKSWTNRQKFRVIISSKLCKSLLLLLSFPRCPKIYNVYYLTCIVLFTATFLTQTAPYFCLDPEITHPDNVRYSSSTLQSHICDCIKNIWRRTLVFGPDHGPLPLTKFPFLCHQLVKYIFLLTR